MLEQRKRWWSRAVLVVLAPAIGAFAQQPVISPEGVVNAASFARDPERGLVMVRGAIYSIFGQNLAASAQAATATPLPTTLAGTSVTVGGIPAPLFYVSPGQINLQTPGRVTGRPVPVVVTTAAGVSDPVLVTVVLDAGGIFAQEPRGCGQGAVLNVAPDGSVTLNTPDQSATPGGFVSIYGTGLGPVGFAPGDGHPAPSDPLTYFQVKPFAAVGLDGFQRQVPYLPAYAGRAPGLVGVDQVNLKIPDDAPEGCAVPLKLQAVTSTSQPVMISIRRGGGACQDAPEARFATLRWHKTVTTGPEPTTVAGHEMFTTSFGAAPENQVVPLPDPVPRAGYSRGRLTPPPGPGCRNVAPRALDAGVLTLEGLPRGPLIVPPSSTTGEIVYAATLPAGSIQGRAVRVTAAGGAGVGAFQTGLSIPAPIQITTPLPPGTVIRNTQPFRVTWTNGIADAVVRMRLVAHIPDGEEPGCEATVLASDGEASIGLLPAGTPYFPLPDNNYAEVVIMVGPRAGQVHTFSAPGLTREGRHEWLYEYRFKGLRIGPQ